MKILFDQGTPAPLKNHLPGHTVSTAYIHGWSQLKNGDLLNAAEADGFELLNSTAQDLEYQQNLENRRIAIIVLTTTSWPRIKHQVDVILAAIDSVNPGSYAVVEIH